MFRPFKRLEAKWNAHTPVYLHPRTKENFIFQIILAVLLVLGLIARDEWEAYQLRKKVNKRLDMI